MKSSGFLGKIPFLRLLVFFTGGIFAGPGQDEPVIRLLFLMITIILLLTVTVFINGRQPISGASILATSVITMTIMFLAGMLAVYPGNRKGSGINSIPVSGSFIAIISDLPEDKPGSIKVEVTVTAIADTTVNMVKKFSAVVYFQKNQAAADLLPGMMICMRTELRNISAPLNPGEFDYRRYLANHNIYRQAYVPATDWCILPQQKFTVMTISMLCRKRLLDKFSNLGMSQDEAGALSAITLGYRKSLNSDVRESFTAAGVMHVMALSGFNVGVIAAFIGLILSFAKGSIRGNRIRTFIIIPSLWGFAFITGLSPSVTRAAVMLSLVMAGKTMGKHVLSFNIILGSAFLMLAANPRILNDTGFQLSFCAVSGIIAFHPVLAGIVKTRSGIVKRIWQFFTLSIAAQAATLPVSLFYFHQFPVYFWITNLYAVPLVSAIIYVSSFYLMVSFIGPLSLYPGKILVWLVRCLLQSVSIVEQAPASLIDGICVSKTQLFITAALVISIIMFIRYRKRILVNISLLCGAGILICGLCDLVNARKQHTLVINNIRGATVITFISGRDCLLLANPDSLITPAVLSWSFDNYLTRKRITNFEVCDTWNADNTDFPGLSYAGPGNGNMVLSFHGKTILRITDPAAFILTEDGVPDRNNREGKSRILAKTTIDILLISCKDYRLMESLMSTTSFKLLVIDSSVSQYYSGKWAEASMENGVPFHDVRNGAYTIDGW